MDSFETAGLDGVDREAARSAVPAGARDAVAKVKPEKTADCVVVGDSLEIAARSRSRRCCSACTATTASSLYVGSAAVAASRHAEIAERVLPLLDETSERRFSEPNRWGTGDLEETPLRPELVCRGALRQGAGHAIAARDQAAAVPRRQDAGRLHAPRDPAGAGTG